MDVASAIRTQLATYLQSALVSQYPTLQALDAWPDAGKPLPEYAVTVLVSGAPQTEYHGPIHYQVTPGVSPVGAVRITYGMVTVPLQLDAWATFRARRDLLAGSVRDALNRHPGATLGVSGLWPDYQRQAGLVIRVSALLNAPCDFRFESLPVPQESGESAQGGEWRAMWSGTARMHLVSEEQVALIKKLEFGLDVSGHTDTKTIAP
jgi:hypothetical protein